MAPLMNHKSQIFGSFLNPKRTGLIVCSIFISSPPHQTRICALRNTSPKYESEIPLPANKLSFFVETFKDSCFGVGIKFSNCYQF